MPDKKTIYSIAANVELVRSRLTKASLYENLAEECVELAQACLKKARKIREENYTPLTDKQIDASINEEYADISLVAATLGLHKDYKLMLKKCRRWVERNVPVPGPEDGKSNETD